MERIKLAFQLIPEVFAALDEEEEQESDFLDGMEDDKGEDDKGEDDEEVEGKDGELCVDADLV